MLNVELEIVFTFVRRRIPSIINSSLLWSQGRRWHASTCVSNQDILALQTSVTNVSDEAQKESYAH